MSYYQENKEKLKDKYHNQSGKEKAKEYIKIIKKLLKEKQELGFKICLKTKKN